MVKKDELAALAIIGVGIWFLSELAKNKGDVTAYRCWNCQGMIKPGEERCPWCGARQDWRRIR
jgi:rRNA maturation endonuclease Nob1